MSTQNQQFDNTNRGSVFANDRKEKETQPDMTGRINLNGVDHYASLWTREAKSGVTYLSVSLREVRENMEGSPQLNGALFSNDKRGNDKAPDYNGKIDDTNLRLSAWITDINSGERAGQQFLSVAVSQQQAQSAATGTDSAQAPAPQPESDPEPKSGAKLPF